jgi:hypothetical protein
MKRLDSEKIVETEREKLKRDKAEPLELLRKLFLA